MRINRGLLFWGLGLITAGGVALAIQQGLLDRDVMAGAWQLWPLILVAIGISLIVARTPAAPLGTALAAVVIGTIVGTAIAVGPGIGVGCGSGSDPTALEDHSGTFGSDAVSLDWRLNCGSLDVSMSGDSGWKASVGSTGNDRPTVSGTQASLRIASADTSGWVLDHGRERWVVTLPTSPSYDANLRANAGKFTMNLAGATFSSFAFQPNAADVHLDVSDASVSDLDLEMNAGSANITASSGTAAGGLHPDERRQRQALRPHRHAHPHHGQRDGLQRQHGEQRADAGRGHLDQPGLRRVGRTTHHALRAWERGELRPEP